MPEVAHILERRAKLLAEHLAVRRDLLREALAPAGTRPPFTVQLSQREALSWWQQHRYDDLGKQLVERMKPESVLELDAALAQQNESMLAGGLVPVDGSVLSQGGEEVG